MNQTIPELKDQAAFQLEVLGHKGVGYTEYRNIGAGKFVGINPRKTPTGTTNQDVAKITCIVIDIDATNVLRNMTFRQYAELIIKGENLQSYVLVNSGRGMHIYIPIDLPLNTNVKDYFEYLRHNYYNEGFIIDKIHDSARVIRVWGSTNEKNGNTCQVIDNKYNGRNTFKLPTLRQAEVKQNKGVVEAIFNGGRNNQLTSLAGTMRSKGMTEDAIKAALLEENKQRCNPPLPESEVIYIAHSISRYNPTIQKVQVSKSLSQDSAQYLERLLVRKPGYSIGFPKLDKMLAGLQKGRMYVLAARTNQGKTSFACNVAYNLIKENISVLYFPTELSSEPLYDKILSQLSEIPLSKFQFGDFSEEETGKIKALLERLKTFPFNVEEDFGTTLDKINLAAKRTVPKVIILDFIQAMKYLEGSPSEIAANVRGIKELAEEMQIPVIMCSQFNRGAIGNELSLGQLKGSGSIEEFADVVMALSVVNGNVSPKVVDLHILKNRYSELGKVRLDFYSEFGKFKEQNNP